MSKNLRITELDFDTIKTNLKNFLQDQDEFTDYDFEGSGLSVLLDVLAYNTHYNAYIANMLVNEMFLDSAVKRASAVSIAKHLGYTPISARGARAVINVTVTNVTGSPSSLTLDRFSPFSTTIAGTAYTFLNLDEVTVPRINDQYFFEELTVVEGTLSENTFVSVEPGPDEKFEIPSSTIDTSTLLVTVQNSATDTTTQNYTLTNDITGIDGDSNVFFLEENPFGRYQIFFGDGILGKKLTQGNIITVRYLSVSGSDANTSSLITQSFTSLPIGNSSDITIETITNSSSGTAKESISSIKFNAPIVNAARNRAVTAADYEALVRGSFSDAESVSAWGGEDNDPPIYGKVFISLKPFSGFVISQSTKDNIIQNILRNKKVLAIQPEFVDPEFFYVGLNVRIQYDSTITSKTSSNIQTIVRNTITNYFSSDLQKFNRDFNKSRLIKLILDSDPSIVSVIMTLKLQKRILLTLNEQNIFRDENKINFENAVVPGTLISSRFFTTSANTTVSAVIYDIPNTMPPDNNGSGTLNIRNVALGTVLSSNIGSISYGTGEVIINGFTPTSLPNNVNDFRLTASVQETSHNIQANRNQILVIDDSTQNALVGRDAGVVITVTPVVQ